MRVLPCTAPFFDGEDLLRPDIFSPLSIIRSLVLLSAALLLCAVAANSQEIEPNETIRVDANLVSIPVIVSDRDGRYVPGLTQADFQLLDNGAEQPIAFFDNTEAPLNVAILLDTSRSTEGVLGKIKDAAKNFIKQLRPQDRAMIVSFDFDIHRLSDLTSDRKVLEKAIKKAEVGEFIGTVLTDAVYDVIDRDLKPIIGRKAIILLTDGEDAGSNISEPGLINYVGEADTVIYSVSYPSGGQRRFRPDNFPFPGRGGPRRRGGIFGGGFPRGRFNHAAQFPQDDRFPGRGGQGPGQGRGGGPNRGGMRDRRKEAATDFLTRLSNTTGGRYYRSDGTDLKKTFDLIAEELRHQYRLGFYPDPANEARAVHALNVKVSRPNTAVRARGWYRTVKPR